jgi:hypothetical protein
MAYELHYPHTDSGVLVTLKIPIPKGGRDKISSNDTFGFAPNIVRGFFIEHSLNNKEPKDLLRLEALWTLYV